MMPPGGPQFRPPYGPPPPGYPAPPPVAGYGPPAYPPVPYAQPAAFAQPTGYPQPPAYAQPPAAYPHPAVPPSGHAGPPAAVPSGYAHAPGGPPVVIDVGKTNGRKAIIGASVAGVVGLIAVGSSLAGAVDGGSTGVVIGLVFGLLFLALPAALFARKDKVFRPQLLVFEQAGVRWDDPKGAPWAVPWSELAAVSISKHSPKQIGSESLQDKLVSATSDKLVGERAHVRLDLYPADPGFTMRHPEMAHLWERQGVKGGYRLPLGSNVKFIPVIAGAMGRFAPRLYRGVNATEGFMGLS